MVDRLFPAALPLEHRRRPLVQLLEPLWLLRAKAAHQEGAEELVVAVALRARALTRDEQVSPLQVGEQLLAVLDVEELVQPLRLNCPWQGAGRQELAHLRRLYAEFSVQ